MTDLVGKRLGDFEVVREVGRGGMGVVYEARQISLNRRVALKILAPGLGLTPLAVARFRREAEAAAKLHHTSIVPVYATGTKADLHFYAMELIEGPSLDRVIAQLREQRGSRSAQAEPVVLPELTTTGPYHDTSTPTGSGASSGLSSVNSYFDAVARAIADVADALHHAHQHNIIHRDVKPGNLLLSPDGRLSVNDFGLARVLEEPGMTTTGEFMGTPTYVAPEQIAGGRIPVDHRCDVYSLGATLYELLTLRPPFVAAGRDQLLALVTQKEPPAPHAINPRVPRDLETICLKCLEKDPDRRYRTAKELADDLRRYVNRYAILARRPGLFTKGKKWVKRNPSLTAALAAVLVCAGVAAGLAYQAHRTDRAHEEAQLRHAADLLEEKRRAALEKAILASRLEDFDGARQAIREAEKLGCSPGQVRMLQGQFELYQGHVPEAVDHLTQAVELLPESVAAQGMLAVAYFKAGRITEYYGALGEATRGTPVVPDDYLFRGHAESLADSDRGLRSLDEAVRQRPSILAHLIRLDVLRVHVLDSPDLEKAKMTMDDVQVLKRQIPDNVTVLSLSIAIHTVCYHVFGELRQPELRQAALTEGLKDAKALERFGLSPRAVLARWTFLFEVGQPAATLADLQRVCSDTKDLQAVLNCGVFLYTGGTYGEAAKVLELCRGETVIDVIRLMALAELPDGPMQANNLYKEIAARNPGAWDRFNSQLILRFLGRKQEAVELSRQFLKQPERFPPLGQDHFQRALEYCAGQLSAEKLIASTGGKRQALSNAHVCIALTALADGERETARRHLQQCEATRYFEALPYGLSLMLLSRMDSDPNWPPWIPHVAPAPHEPKR